MGYSRSMHSTVSSNAGLPEHHLRATLELLATPSETSSTDSTKDSDRWAGADFSGLHDPDDLHRSMGAYDYLFGFPNSDEDYDPSRECFHMEVEEIALGDATPVG
jgi:hypothetical protein